MLLIFLHNESGVICTHIIYTVMCSYFGVLQLSFKGAEISYIALVYEAEDFCNLVNESLMEHADGVRRLYPSYTICYLTNRLMAYINKRSESNIV